MNLNVTNIQYSLIKTALLVYNKIYFQWPNRWLTEELPQTRFTASWFFLFMFSLKFLLNTWKGRVKRGVVSQLQTATSSLDATKSCVNELIYLVHFYILQNTEAKIACGKVCSIDNQQLCSVVTNLIWGRSLYLEVFNMILSIFIAYFFHSGTLKTCYKNVLSIVQGKTSLSSPPPNT